MSRTVTARSQVEDRWTPQRVAGRLAEAVDVVDRLPADTSAGRKSSWPRPVDGGGRTPSPPAPSPEAIDRMDEALGWLLWLESEERRLLWWRAEGVPWKRITGRLGIGRTTAWQRWTVALLKIATALNTAAEQKCSNIKTLNNLPGLRYKNR